MNIEILHLIDGAKKARGLTVIIDVFRAFTTACYIMANGAKRIISVGEIETAYKLKKDNPDYILIGERKGRTMPGFDYGNSPAHIEKVDFTGRTIIQTTSAGTQGIVNAVHAGEIITGSFVNARAVVNYVKEKKPDEISLVCMGLEGRSKSDEDIICAEYIRHYLSNLPFDFEPVPEKLRNSSGRRFFNPASQDWAPERDFTLCLQPNLFNFVLKAEREAGLLYLKRIDLEQER